MKKLRSDNTKKGHSLHAVVRRHWWKWVCEFCFKKCNRNTLPPTWDLVWQSAVCPDCQRRVQSDGGYAVVKGGAYAVGKRDPREMTPNDRLQ